MKTLEKIALGGLAAAGALWGTRALLRSYRRIDYRDRVVVVTGADSGFGLILCQQLARQGALLVMAARKAERLDEAADAVRSLGARDVLTVPTDVSVQAESENLIARAIDRFGRIDVLINNAGLMIVGPAEAMTIEDYHTLLDTNFWGSVYPTLAAMPHMRAQKFGRIGNVVSIGGRFVVPHMVPYIASKFALTGFTKAMRAEASRDNVFVTGIYPATIRTGGHTHAWIKGDQRAEYAWFGLSDVLPGVATSAETAATKSLKAIQVGDPEVVVGLSARLGVALEGALPNWSAELIQLIERTMPAPANLDATAVQGQEIRGQVADFVNRLVPTEARA